MIDPEVKFWADFKVAIAQSDLKISTDPRFSPTESRKLYYWLERDVPVESIAFLLEVIEAIDCELVIKNKEE